jgi:nickel superoxide dismutase
MAGSGRNWRADGEKLVALVNRFAEIFWATRDIQTVRRPSPIRPR